MRYICTQAYEEYLFQSAINLSGSRLQFEKQFYHAFSMYTHTKCIYYMARDSKQQELIQECLKLMRVWKPMVKLWANRTRKNIELQRRLRDAKRQRSNPETTDHYAKLRVDRLRKDDTDRDISWEGLRVFV